MTIFITRARLTKDGLRELTAAPEDRLQALSRLISQVGGKLVTYFLTSGDYDLLLIFEGPSFEALAPALIAAAAASGLTDLNTVVALTASDMKSALTKAGALTARNDTAVAAADVPSAGSEAEPTDEASEEAKWAAAILDARADPSTIYEQDVRPGTTLLRRRIQSGLQHPLLRSRLTASAIQRSDRSAPGGR